MLIRIDTIKTSRSRIRKTLGDLEQLSESLKRFGLINPIIIDSKRRLIAGQRRLEAAKLIGWKNIEAVMLDGSTKDERFELELEENIQRKELTAAELTAAYERLNKMRNPGILRRLWNGIKKFFARLFFKE